MSLSNIVNSAVVAGALAVGTIAVGACASEPVHSLREVHHAPYSVDEVLQAYNNEILPLYADEDPRNAFQNLSNNRQEIFSLMQTYLSAVDEQSLASATPDQKRALAVAYGDFGFVAILARGAGYSVPLFERAVALEPQNVLWHVRYANVLYLEQRFPEALNAVERCLQIDPANNDALLLQRLIRDHQ